MLLLSPRLMAENVIATVGYNTEYLRKSRDLLQVDFAKICKIRQQKVSTLEQKQYKRSEFLETAFHVSNAFNLDPAVFLFENIAFPSSRPSPDAFEVAHAWDQAPPHVQMKVKEALFLAAH